jgi:hypothetical protein
MVGCLALALSFASIARYTADWSSLDSRPNPKWYVVVALSSEAVLALGVVSMLL